ncbi:MAG TPA: ATP phosphoribosyltransferase [Pyrinomonadaceae bacterium]
MITIAIAKGRMQDDALALLARADVHFNGHSSLSRCLISTDDTGAYRAVFVKPADVPVYVEHGIADCGIVGRDVLLESKADLLVPLDLEIARCRLVVAGPSPGEINSRGMLRVATKYPQLTAEYFGSRGTPVEIIHLSGSVELAPSLRLCDVIVDLVETGRTLQENGLSVIAVITESTGRFVVNRASYQLKADSIARLLKSLEQTLSGVSA